MILNEEEIKRLNAIWYAIQNAKWAEHLWNDQ